MKDLCIIGVCAIAVCVPFSATVHAYDTNIESHGDANWDTVGSGSASASYFPVAEASASVTIYYGDPTSGGAGYGYGDLTFYVVDYDSQVDPPLTLHVSGLCEAKVNAGYNPMYSHSYSAMAGSSGYGAGQSCSAGASISYPDPIGVDADWFDTDVNVSYQGATVYFGHSAWAMADAYSTTGPSLSCSASAASQTCVWVIED